MLINNLQIRQQWTYFYIMEHRKDVPPVPPIYKIWTDGNLNKIVDGNGKYIVFKVNP